MILSDSERRKLRELEERLMRPEVRGDAGLLDALIAGDFVEFGASGRIFDKRSVITLLADEPLEGGVALSDLSVRVLAEGPALVTYVTEHAGRQVPRSSIWRRVAGRWQVVFHQGTPADDSIRTRD